MDDNIFSGLIDSMKPMMDMPKELQISNIALTLTVTGIQKGLTPKEVTDYFYEVVNNMKKHKRTK
jgi:hypothetical protein